MPEAPEVTTAVPTYIRCSNLETTATVFPLQPADVEVLEQLLKDEIAKNLETPELTKLPSKEFFEQVKRKVKSGYDVKLLESLNNLLHRKDSYLGVGQFTPHQVSVEEMQRIVQAEDEALFIDRVVVNLKSNLLPPDIEFVDLPGVSVPNPRHKQITFSLLATSHAIVYVCNPNQLFNEAEHEVLKKISQGEQNLSEKTFWVINLWDRITHEEQRNKIERNLIETLISFNIRTPQYFKTDALHGLCAQLSISDELPEKSPFAVKLKEYQADLAKYGSSHQEVLKTSGIPILREKILNYLDAYVRERTLRDARDSIKVNFCSLLRFELEKYASSGAFMTESQLEEQKARTAIQNTDQKIRQLLLDIEGIFAPIISSFVLGRATVLDENPDNPSSPDNLRQFLTNEIKSGNSTNALVAYEKTFAAKKKAAENATDDSELDSSNRRYPYYLEIEIQVVDSLNKLLKEKFVEITKGQLYKVTQNIVNQVNNLIQSMVKDIGHDVVIDRELRAVLKQTEDETKTIARSAARRSSSYLDALLAGTPNIWNFWDRKTAIINGLVAAAHIGKKEMYDDSKSLRDNQLFVRKTQKIRSVLLRHYVDEVMAYRQLIARELWTEYKEQLIECESALKKIINSEYKIRYQQLEQKKIAGSGSFEQRKKDILQHSKFIQEALKIVNEISSQI